MSRRAVFFSKRAPKRWLTSLTTGTTTSSNRNATTLASVPAIQQSARQKTALQQTAKILSSTEASQLSTCCRRFSSTWTGRGQDFLGDSFMGGQRPKVLLEAIGPSGFDVSNLIKRIDPNEVAPHGALHMTGSILAFPNACFLWRIEDTSEITVESLSPVLLHRPKIEYLFIGASKSMDREQLGHLKNEMKEKAGIVVEWLPLAEAMSTFNILNGEDRMVATALVLDTDESHFTKDED